MVMAIGLGPIDCKFKSYRSEPTKACFRHYYISLVNEEARGGIFRELINQSVKKANQGKLVQEQSRIITEQEV
jgi:hypothetical protein